MRISWNDNWIWLQAVPTLFIAPSLIAPEICTPSWLDVVLRDAYGGRFGRVREDKAFKALAIALSDVASKLKARMSEVGLTDHDSLPPILWFRLAQEAGLAPHSTAKEQFETWQETNRTQGMLPLYLRNKDDKLYGPKREREGYGKVIGYSVLELLEEKRDKPRNWPYCRNWEAPNLKRQRVNTAQETVDKLGNDLIANDQSDAEVPEKPTPETYSASKRRKRSRADIERVCGSGVFQALEQCLSLNAKSKQNLVQLRGRNRRQYNCQLSLDELVEALKKKYSDLIYRESTIKSVLPYFVSCPRGRPARYIDQPKAVVASKKKRL